MALPQNTSLLIRFLRPSADPLLNYEVSSKAGVISIKSYDAVTIGQAEPTEQELLDAEADLTTVNGQTFTQWYNENGADLTLTRRKQAKEQVDESSKLGLEMRAMIQLMNKRDNYLVNRIIELQDRVQAMLDSVGGADAMRTAGLGVTISTTETRNLTEAKQDYKDDIGLGIAD